MPVTCIVINCASRADPGHTLRFFRIPTVTKFVHYPHLNELSLKRREMWIAAIKRRDLTDSILKHQRVCCKHFITGKPSDLKDENHPDWVPSQHLGFEDEDYFKRKSDVDRKSRLDKRRKIADDKSSDEQSISEDIEQHQDIEVETGRATQTCITTDMLSTQKEQLRFATKKIAELEKKIENSPSDLWQSINNEQKWKYYTGFDYEFIKTIIFPEIEPYVSSTSTTVLSPFNQMLLTLEKLRLNLSFNHLAFYFKESASTASICFQNVIHIMYERLNPLVIWPDTPESEHNIPVYFKEVFQDKRTIIIDCFEVFIERPGNYLTQQQCWSKRKHHNTIKFLIGITPQGTISYISKGWGGRTSDKQMVELGDFLNHIRHGDVVLADKGFIISKSLGIVGAFTKPESQLRPFAIEETRHLAQVRIHVEKIIGVVKNKFRILKGPLPIKMLQVGNDEVCILDKIVTVCSALINILPPIVPL